MGSELGLVLPLPCTPYKGQGRGKGTPTAHARAEIELHQRDLEGALAEVRRVREQEEAQLAARIAAARSACALRAQELEQEYRRQVGWVRALPAHQSALLSPVLSSCCAALPATQWVLKLCGALTCLLWTHR